MKLSVAMIVKNEESCLENCLKSLEGLVDEIVICDTGSKDRTVEIAKKYTNKVFTDYKWEDSFCKARNYALSKCTGDWVLSIDADEIMLDGGIESIRKTIADNPNEFSLSVTMQNAGNPNTTNLFPKVFKRCKEVFWMGAAHNYITKRANIHSGATIVYGYSKAHKGDPDRTLRILKAEVEKDRTLVRETFYLAREYYYRKDYTTAVYWYDEYLKIATWTPEIADAYLMRARCLWQLQRGEEARHSCYKAILYNADFKEALLFMADMVHTRNRDNWLMFAEIVENKNVLFVRNRAELSPDFYGKLPDGEARYLNIYEKVQELVGKTTEILDIGCGPKAPLAKYFDSYDGFDLCKNPMRIADAYDPKSYTRIDYSGYTCLEVLEHLSDDLKVLANIPKGKPIIFSVPSFYCPGHVRVYTLKTLTWRFRNLLDIHWSTRFNWCKDKHQWEEGGEETPEYITLCVAVKK
jgi:glycosyltransferase involved in cell wall biosynthesis